jgi:hypothetical protein
MRKAFSQLYVLQERYVAPLVDPNEPARFSPCQKRIADRQKIWFAFKFFHTRQHQLVTKCFIILPVSNFFLTVNNFYVLSAVFF